MNLHNRFRRRGRILTFKDLTPSSRVALAMQRLSRNRWLHPKEVQRIAWALARCACTAPANVVKHAYSSTCEAVGMYQGLPLAVLGTPAYSKTLRSIEKDTLEQDMDTILQHILEAQVGLNRRTYATR